MPLDIAFLGQYGVPSRLLHRARDVARMIGEPASEVLIASGEVSAARYYLSLATHLGLPFIHAHAPLDTGGGVGMVVRSGFARLTDDARGLCVIAPSGMATRDILAARRAGLGLPRAAVTTPAHLSALARHAARAAVADDASHALARRYPELCAKRAVEAARSWRGAGLVLAAALAGLVAPRAVSIGLGLLFLAAMSCRLLLCANRFRARPGAEGATPLLDRDLPFYSILVPLHDEAHMVAELVSRLDAIDYPAVKLEIKLIVEHDDATTFAALKTVRLSPVYEIIVAPPGLPRTKPRALNIALPVIRGEYVTIYDAEDAPDPDQLRKAAARFAEAPPDVACLQASLAIRDDQSRLTRLFAIEYAALFDLYNVGVGLARMPMALGGTSNHIRTRVLRDLRGWDAWNVAEDADLGFRLARFGYRAEALDSTTLEQAPRGLGAWFKQRRRWTKGWIQTILVLARRPIRAARDLGPTRTGIMILMAVSLIVGPVLSPLLVLLVAVDLWTNGPPSAKGPLGVAVATLWVSVFIMGVAGPLWTGYAGIKLRRLEAFLPTLPLILPYQIMIATAAMAGLIDLLRAPYHWHKTHHYAEGDGTRPKARSPFADLLQPGNLKQRPL